MPKPDAVTDLLNRSKAILETMVDGVITINNQGLIDTVNPAAERIFGYQSQELIGRNVSMLMPSPYREEHDGYIHSYLTTGTKKVIDIGREVRGQRKNGDVFPMELAVSEMLIKGERMFTGIVRDISERKDTEEKLREAMRRVHEQRIKDEFISTVSHELRTPLTSIKASLDILKSGALTNDPEKSEALIDIAQKNSERLLLLINDILDISKIESEKMQYRITRIPLRSFLETAISDNRVYGDKYQVRYVLGECPDHLSIEVDPDRMMQVMSNLLSNAAKFSPLNTEVHVSAEETKHGVRIVVKDQGKGIPEEFQPHIFEKFTQADSSNQRAIGGTGLGLHISKAIVEHHEGELSFNSSVKNGTEFYIDLRKKGETGACNATQ